MTPEQAQRVQALFEAALEVPPIERAVFLDAACSSEAWLKQEVASLLAALDEAGSFIEAPAAIEALEGFTPEQPESRIGQRIGAYRIIRELGHGGMGAVYLAVRADDQYHKQVAIKLVKPEMSAEFILRRFRHERQILAHLDHPNIAKLLDGGTTEDGLPYFVMDYIEGVPITVYCDTHRLSTLERLKLFRTVCSAVHYAHQNLVIHRDLKPGNILVTAEGVPKLLDFGIAKLLNPEWSSPASETTATMWRLMTPDYASPEQVRGEAITTASDVYSLGVLLYELLTGHRPYRLKGRLPHEVLQAVCEEEPVKPSTAISRESRSSGAKSEIPNPKSETNPKALNPKLKTAGVLGALGFRILNLFRISRFEFGISQTRDKLARQLRGDLDNTVLMALRKEPQRRYGSVEQFSEDIRRHLEGLPVVAHRDTFAYRSTKFVKRNKIGVAVAALIVVLLLAGVAVISWEAHVAAVQRAKAERRFNDVRELANSFMFEVNGAIEHLPGTTPARVLLVQRALTYLDSLAQEASDDRSLQLDLARAYLNVGDIQGRPYRPNVGDTAGALMSYRKALANLSTLARAEPNNLDVRYYLSIAYQDIGRLQMARAPDRVGALESEHQALAASEELITANPANAHYRKLLADNYLNLGMAMYGPDLSVEDCTRAMGHLRKALSLHEALAASEPANGEYRWAVGDDYEFIGYFLGRLGDLTGDRENHRLALENHRKELEINAALSASDPTNMFFRRILSDALNDVGNSHLKLGDAAQALESFRRRLPLCQAIAASDPTNAEARRELAASHHLVGLALAERGDVVGALEESRKALAGFEALLNADPMNTDNRMSLIEAHDQIGSVLEKTGNMAGALGSYRNALAILETWSATAPASTGARVLVAIEYANLGRVYAMMASKAKSASERQEAWREARAWYQRGFEIWQKMREQNLLTAADADKAEKVRKEILRCETALGK